MIFRSFLTICTDFALTGCNYNPRPLSETDIEDHKTMSQQFQDYLYAKDWKYLSEMYEDDAVVMQMYTNSLSGQSEINKFWSDFPPIKELRFIDDGIIGEGNLAYVYGK